jgi:hypothetical protein
MDHFTAQMLRITVSLRIKNQNCYNNLKEFTAEVNGGKGGGFSQ